jgi:acetylglutamate kinase
MIVVKIGGSTLGHHDTTLEDIVELQKRGIDLVVVHGGGKLITEWLTRLGVSTRFVQGERVTDKATWELPVYWRSVKKDRTAIGNLGGKAAGIQWSRRRFVEPY